MTELNWVSVNREGTVSVLSTCFTLPWQRVEHVQAKCTESLLPDELKHKQKELSTDC